MRRILALMAVLATVVTFAVIARAADSFTVSAVANTEADWGAGWPNAFYVVKAAWKAAADGSKADGTIPAFKGYLVGVQTDPGSTAPADNYDLTIKDAQGQDIMGGALADRDTANTEYVVPKVDATPLYGPRPVYGPLTVTFTNTANANCDGVLYLFYEE